MKTMMMFKALILIHLWSIVVACCAWGLQRDNGGRIGTSFPEPKVWLTLIILSLLPGVISLLPFGMPINLPKVEIFEALATPASGTLAEGSSSLNYLAIYMFICLLLMSRTLWRWSRLQYLPLMPTAEPDIFTTTSRMPPLTLSWPRRAVVIPFGFQAEAALIRHERTHLHHNDAELTLLFLLLQDMMLRGPGVSYLVRQWRLSIELRADHAATKMLTASERKAYAALLLNGLRSSGNHAGRVALPCPTANLTSTRHRGVKLRLSEIMEGKPNPRKRRWSAALLLTTLGASALGLVNTTASAKDDELKAATDGVVYVTRVSPQLPASCPGLKFDDLKFEEKGLNVNGKVVQQHTVKFGTVILKHDVRRDGSLDNVRIVESTNPCFEAGAKASVAQWMAEPQSKDVKDEFVKVPFIITGDTIEDLKPQIKNFLQ